jgi:hypothetical protein
MVGIVAGIGIAGVGVGVTSTAGNDDAPHPGIALTLRRADPIGAALSFRRQMGR